METKIKIITAGDFIEITADGIIDFTTSRQLLADIAQAGHLHAEYKLLVDFRGTHSQLTITDVYRLAGELCQHGNAFHRKVALVVAPGLNFDQASFFETCSHNRGFSVTAYTDYEKAIRWILTTDN